MPDSNNTKGLNHLFKDCTTNPVVKNKSQIVVSTDGKIIGNSNDLNQIIPEETALLQEYLSAVKKQISEEEFFKIKFNYKNLLPNNWDKEIYLQFTDLIVNKKPIKINDEELIDTVTLPEFWQYVNQIRTKLKQVSEIETLRKKLINKFYTVDELKDFVLDEFVTVAVESILTQETVLDNLIREALGLGASDKKIHTSIEKIWCNPVIKFNYQIGHICQYTIEHYQKI